MVSGVLLKEHAPLARVKVPRTEFKRVPAVDKCISVLELFGRRERPLGISEISSALKLNKSTVFNIVYTLTDRGVLENYEGKFCFGPKLYVLGKAAGENSELIKTIHPYLEEISQETNLSAFLGRLSGLWVVIVDKVDPSSPLKISSGIGKRMPLLAEATGRALLSQLSDKEIDDILSQDELRSFSHFSRVNKKTCLEMIRKVRKNGIAIDREQYVGGVRALAVPLKIDREGLRIAITVIGLKNQIKNDIIPLYSNFLKDTARKIENRFSFG